MEFSYDDRLVLALEAELWAIRGMLMDLPNCHWTNRVVEVRTAVETIAKEIREYHDQFES